MIASRNESLDALRGLAILGMILSGSIAHSDVMPSWMFHAQVPPPAFKFIPTLPGITWVDLVFPLFLFAMGAAMPLALNKYIEKAEGFPAVLKIALKRFFLLTFFALFSHQMKAWVLSENPGLTENLLSVASFGLLFIILYDYQNEKQRRVFNFIKIAALCISVLLMYFWHYWHQGFDLYKSDIIIMLLGNMALFGTLIYYFTHDKPWLRLGILPFIFAVFVAAKEPGASWTKELYTFHQMAGYKFDWVYQFYFLKYLFIVIPGTFAGEWILRKSSFEKEVSDRNKLSLAWISFFLIVFNLIGLYTRVLEANVLVTVVLCGMAYYLISKENIKGILKCFVQTGSYALILGLFLEAYEGGIKKDVSTYSYYFVTSGLAFFVLILFNMIANTKFWSKPFRFLALTGKNPMVAYVAGSLLLMPLMAITGIKSFWEAMSQNALMGTLKGIIFTFAVAVITIYFVRRKWFWKT